MKIDCVVCNSRKEPELTKDGGLHMKWYIRCPDCEIHTDDIDIGEFKAKEEVSVREAQEKAKETLEYIWNCKMEWYEQHYHLRCCGCGDFIVRSKAIVFEDGVMIHAHDDGNTCKLGSYRPYTHRLVTTV